MKMSPMTCFVNGKMRTVFKICESRFWIHTGLFATKSEDFFLRTGPLIMHLFFELFIRMSGVCSVPNEA